MDYLIVLMMSSLRADWLDDHWYPLMVKCLYLMKALNWDYLVVKCFALYLEMYMESNLGFVLE